MERSSSKPQSWFDPAPAFDPSMDFDYERAGKHFGNLCILHSANETGWQTVRVPVVCIQNGEGPTLLLLGGTHGDEVEGPVVLLRLAREVQPSDIRGRLIIIPALNYPAVEAGRRGAPADGRDLNRSFPGRPDGTLADGIAHYVDNVLLPKCDVVLDLHAGGRDARFLPSLWLLEGPDPALWERTLQAAGAFGAPFAVVSASLGGDMSESAARRGCVYISTEAGGAATIDREVVAFSDKGIRRLMAHLGLTQNVLAPDPKPMRLLRVPDSHGVLLAENYGLFEPVVSLGDQVKKGQVIGRIHLIDRPDTDAPRVVAPIEGLVYGLRCASHVRRGARLATFAINEGGSPVSSPISVQSPVDNTQEE